MKDRKRETTSGIKLKRASYFGIIWSCAQSKESTCVHFRITASTRNKTQNDSTGIRQDNTDSFEILILMTLFIYFADKCGCMFISHSNSSEHQSCNIKFDLHLSDSEFCETWVAQLSQDVWDVYRMCELVFAFSHIVLSAYSAFLTE